MAGRESEQALCRDVLYDLRNGLAPPREIVFHGPRGNGKTALLVWLQQEAALFPGIDVVRLTPSGIPSISKFVEQLLPASWIRKLAPGEITLHGVTWRPGQGDPPPLHEALAARARKRPLILLLDEAHTLEERIGCALLNAGQQVGREFPFLLVLAGTPSLRSHLNAMNASFWNRAARRPIGRLDALASAAAIERPLRSENIGIDEDALADLVRESHGYPYFLQLWGAAVWRLAADGVPEAARRRVTRAEVAIAQATFDREKNDYYLDRYEELEKLRLLPVARTVAEAFEGQSLLDEEQLETAIRLGLDPACGPERTAEVKETFRDLGYVWRPEGRPTWEAGVPSLMDYMQENAPVVRLH